MDRDKIATLVSSHGQILECGNTAIFDHPSVIDGLPRLKMTRAHWTNGDSACCPSEFFPGSDSFSNHHEKSLISITTK